MFKHRREADGGIGRKDNAQVGRGFAERESETDELSDGEAGKEEAGLCMFLVERKAREESRSSERASRASLLQGLAL